MPNFGDDNEIRNVGKAAPALVVSQFPGANAAGNPALAINQADTGGAGIVVKSAGTLIDLQNTAGVSKFKVDSAGNVITPVALGPVPGPADFGWAAWTADPAAANASSGALTGGTVYLAEIFLRAQTVLSNVILNVVTGGSVLTSGQNFAGLYDSAGTRQAVTADQTTPWASAGALTIAFTAAYTAPAGRYYVAIVSNGTTPPAFRATTNSPALANAGLAAASLRYCIGATSQTSLPASLTPSSYTGTNASGFGAMVS